MLARSTFLLVLALLVASCGGGGDGGALETPKPTDPEATPVVQVQPTAGVEPPPDATPVSGADIQPVVASRERLAEMFGRNVDEIETLSVTERQWTDSCLGAAKLDEICAQVITAGYEVVLGLEGSTYTYHTDRGGTVRLAGFDLASD